MAKNSTYYSIHLETRIHISKNLWNDRPKTFCFGPRNYFIGCKDSKPRPKYRITLRILLTGLFDTFSVDFATPLLHGSNDEKILLIADEHLTNCLIVRVTKSDISDILLSFCWKTNNFHVWFSKIHSISLCAVVHRSTVQNATKRNKLNWRTALEHAPMRIRKAVQIVRTIKQVLKQSAFCARETRYTIVGNVIWVSSTHAEKWSITFFW